MIGIVISDTFLVVGVWSEEKNDLALHNVKQIEYTEPINDIIHKEGDLNSVLGIAIRRASEAIPFSGQDISVAISDEFFILPLLYSAISLALASVSTTTAKSPDNGVPFKPSTSTGKEGGASFILLPL